MSEPIDPKTGITNALVSFDAVMMDSYRAQPTRPEAASAFMAVAQAHATVALVHAVRELTEAIRAGRTQ